MTKLNKLLKEMSEEIPGYVAGSVVGTDGLSLAIHTSGNTDVETINVQSALVMRLVLQTVKQLGKPTFEDNLFTAENHFILSRFLGDGSYWVILVVDKKNGSLGNIRLISRQFSDEIWDSIPKRRSS
jgi:predicted regulator of Ras-like GTPase activity (Roadblock/LC7/MglB family)